RTNPNKIYYGLYQYPGGKVEENETYRQGAIRELEEEMGIRKNKTDLQYILTHRFEKITCKVFMVETEEIPKQKEPMEMSQWEEIEAEELKDYHMTYISKLMC